VSGKPLDCVGTDAGVGKHDFQLSGPIVHGVGSGSIEAEKLDVVLTRRSPESRERYYAEKIAELVMTQQELARVVKERDALKGCLDGIASWNEGRVVTAHFDEPASARKARETLAKLASGELRKLTG
jgi:hypothetical protein